MPLPCAARRSGSSKSERGRKGLSPRQRAALAARSRRREHARVDGLPCNGGDVFIGPGSKELIFLLQLIFDGDLVLPSPSWVTYAPQAAILKKPVHWLPTSGTNGWRLMPDTLDDLGRRHPGRPFLVILNYPCNPTGLTYSPAHLEALGNVARKHRMTIISDEIYGKLDHAGRHHSISSYYPEGTIVSAGLSKWCGAGGWRLGTFLFPRELRPLLEAMTTVASETFTAVSAPIQFAAVRAYQGGPEIDDYLHRSRRILSALGRHCASRLQDVGASVDTPEGAFYLFPDLSPLAEALRTRSIVTSQDLCERLLDETGVAMLPGSVFGRAADEMTVRLAYVDFNGEEALREVAQATAEAPLSDAFLKKQCGAVVQAIDRLCDWLQAA
ncbi:MAG: pyridoxal phosphate-dependent aminotransferase [Rhodothermales bacterium]